MPVQLIILIHIKNKMSTQEALDTYKLFTRKHDPFGYVMTNHLGKREKKMAEDLVNLLIFGNRGGIFPLEETVRYVEKIMMKIPPNKIKDYHKKIVSKDPNFVISIRKCIENEKKLMKEKSE